MRSGQPSLSRCGGEVTAIARTPATCAGTTFITTLEGYSARPPGTYSPTRRTGTHRWVTVPPGAIVVTRLGRQLGGVTDPGPGDRLGERGPDGRRHHVGGGGDHLGRHPESLRPDPVEALGGVQHGGRAPVPDVLDQRPDAGDGAADVHGGPRQHAAQGAEAGTQVDPLQHGASVRAHWDRSSPRSSAGAEWVSAPTAR